MGRPKGAKDLQPRQPVAPELRCQARSKQTGDQCQQAAAVGQFVCRFHGAKSPKALAGAQQRFLDGLPAMTRRLWDLAHSPNEKIALGAVTKWIELAGLSPVRRSESKVTVNQTSDLDREIAELMKDLAHRKPDLDADGWEEAEVCDDPASAAPGPVPGPAALGRAPEGGESVSEA